MNKLAFVLALVAASTGCGSEPASEIGTSRAALERTTFHLQLGRIAAESSSCKSGLQLDSVRMSECTDAGGLESTCLKDACVTPPTYTTGNEIAFGASDYAGIIGPEIAGIIGPEIAGIIGPEIPTFAGITTNARVFRVKVLDGSGKTLVAKTFKHTKQSFGNFSTDVESIRATVTDKSLVDPQTVQIFVAY